MSKLIDTFMDEHKEAEIQFFTDSESVKVCSISESVPTSEAEASYDPNNYISVIGEGYTTEEAFSEAVEKFEDEERALADKNWSPNEELC